MYPPPGKEPTPTICYRRFFGGTLLGCRSQVPPDAGEVLAVGFAELVRQVALLGEDRDEVDGEEGGGGGGADPEVVEQQPEADQEQGQAHVHGISCEAVGTAQDQ